MDKVTEWLPQPITVYCKLSVLMSNNNFTEWQSILWDYELFTPLQVSYMLRRKISKLHIHISMNHLRLIQCNRVSVHCYVYTTYQGYDSIDDPRAILGLKYMLLCKIMLNTWVVDCCLWVCHLQPANRPEDVPTLVTSKLALQYSGSEVSVTFVASLLCSDWLTSLFTEQLDAMLSVAKSSQNRSVSEFEKV